MIATILGFVLSPIGRWVVGITGGAFMFGSVYLKGRWDQRSADKLKIQQEISNAIAKGQQGSADALRRLHDERLPDSWFRD